VTAGEINLYAGWIGILLGFVAGAVQGLLFHKEDWLGGYVSWQRRMIRLGHISFFGIAFVNLTFAFTFFHLKPAESCVLPSRLFIVGAAGMPLVCYLSAFRKFFRHLFFIPVLSLLAGTGFFIFGVLMK